MKIMELINDLSTISRWSQVHCNRNESVLEHTAFVAMYALRLGIKHEANLNKLLPNALVHDMDEVTTGDIPNPTKYHNERLFKELQKLSQKSAMRISEECFFGDVYDGWINAKDSTKEGDIISISDAAAVSYKIWQEVRSGNTEFYKFKVNILKGLGKIHDKVRISLQDDVLEVIEFTNNIGA